VEPAECLAILVVIFYRDKPLFLSFWPGKKEFFYKKIYFLCIFEKFFLDLGKEGVL